MPAPNYVGDDINSTDVTIGAGSPETGILLGDMSYSHDNPTVEFFDRYGGVIGKATNFNPSLSIDVSGEVEDKDAGVNVDTFIAAGNLTNADFFASSSSTYNGIDYSSTTQHLSAASGSQPRGGGREVSLTYRYNLGLTIT